MNVPFWMAAAANHLWQSTVFLCVAWLLTLALRKHGAQARFWVWCAASLKFLLPFAALAWIGARIGVLVPYRHTATAVPAYFPSGLAQVSAFFAPAARRGLVAAAPTVTSAGINWAQFVVILWLCGAGLFACIWFRKWRAVRAAFRRGRPLRLAIPTRVVESPAIFEPGVFGIVRPVLLLPAGISARMEPAQFAAVLAHEVEHIRRRDNLTGALHMLVESVFWFHPLVWWMGARLTEERERACDDAVLRAGSEPRTYAAGVLRVCELYLQSPLACVAGVTGGSLGSRIERILATRPTRPMKRRMILLLIAAAASALAAPILVGMQSPATLPSFEVASVKPDDPNHPYGIGFRQLDPGGRVVYRAYTLRQLIMEAYELQPYQLSGGPAWIGSEYFNIEAKPPATSAAAKVNPPSPKTTPPPEELLMLRSLLASRFQLVLSEEQHEGKIYSLEPVSGGVKRSQFQPPEHPEERPLITVGREEAPSQEGINYNFTGHNATLALLAVRLEQGLGAPVKDNTGLPGNFDFVLHYAEDDSLASAKYPILPRALQAEFGLRLQAGKGPIVHYTIKRAELPTPN